jgi:hypothetical protein
MRLLLILSLFILYAHSCYDLEHTFYINEIFALCGFIAYIRYQYYKQLKFDMRNPISVLNWFLVVLFLRIVLSLILNEEFNFYIFLRTISVFYSVFIFFLGIYVANNIKISRYVYYPYSIIAAMAGGLWALGLSVILYQGKINRLYMILSVTLGLFIYSRIVNNENTVLCIVLTWLLFFMVEKKYGFLQYIRNYSSRILLFTVFFAIFFIYFIYGDMFKTFTTYGIESIGTDIDKNMYWRLMYWYYLIEQTINHYALLGIGFGNALFSLNNPILEGWLHNELTKPNQYIEYVLGPHNSLIFLFARTGFLGLISFLLVLSSFFKYFLKYIFINPKFIYVFIAINVAMIFNVVLGSPMGSIMYWMSVGLSYGYITIEKNGYRNHSTNCRLVKRPNFL